MNVKLFVDMKDRKGSIQKVFGAVSGLFGVEYTERKIQAHVVICDSPRKCLEYLEAGKFVVQFVTPNDIKATGLKESLEFGRRFEIISVVTFIVDFSEFINRIQEENPSIFDREPDLEEVDPTANQSVSQIRPIKTLRILIVDNQQEHLEAGRRQLSEIYPLVLCRTYEEAIKELSTSTIDVLLSDLLMPAEPQSLGEKGMRFLGQEIAAGFFLAIIAAKHGVGHVAVITDQDSHEHPMSAAVDWISPCVIDKTHVLITHARLKENGAKDWGHTLRQLLGEIQTISD